MHIKLMFVSPYTGIIATTRSHFADIIYHLYVYLIYMYSMGHTLKSGDTASHLTVYMNTAEIAIKFSSTDFDFNFD